MFCQGYDGFVRPGSPNSISTTLLHQPSLERNINGQEAQRLYLEEINSVSATDNGRAYSGIKEEKLKKKSLKKEKFKTIELTNFEIFRVVQNNEIDILKEVLDYSPEKVHVTDEFGWSLLMIACQANAIDCAKEVLLRNIDTNIRDKSGISAGSLVISNKNVVLAELLLEHSQKNEINIHAESKLFCNKTKVKSKEEFKCNICCDVFPDRIEHLSSTIHNINASKGKKTQTNYVIPPSNKGYQILLKSGWNKETGLGRHGTGRKCPVKPVPKYDKSGLGHPGKRKVLDNYINLSNNPNKKTISDIYLKNKQIEINFRREFY